jgi:ubiquinone/menaquinone biosynthesis C-methylase UbiE
VTDYERVARSGDYNRRYDGTRYRDVAAVLSAFVADARRVLEVGCGTGHWVEFLGSVGVDPSRGMLTRAQVRVPHATLVQARGEALPFAVGSFDRVVIVNALHHFSDPGHALREIRRVLSGGGMTVIGLDPSTGRDRWSLYDFFQGTRDRDRARYPSVQAIRTWMERAGFLRVETRIAETMEETMDARAALAKGALAKETTSQLSELSDEAYGAGIAAIERSASEAESRGEVLLFHNRLELHATTGWL